MEERGFCEFLDSINSSLKPAEARDYLNSRTMVCLDVRPLDNCDVRKLNGSVMELGDGIVIREKESRINLFADPDLLDKITHISRKYQITLTRFRGGGITEIEHGWEKVLEPNNIPKNIFHILWIQPPILNYHMPNEEMHIKNIQNLNLLIDKFLECFVQ